MPNKSICYTANIYNVMFPLSQCTLIVFFRHDFQLWEILLLQFLHFFVAQMTARLQCEMEHRLRPYFQN